jgi:hypothetical protein
MKWVHIILTILLALSGCAQSLYCGPGAGRGTQDMLHGMCSEW